MVCQRREARRIYVRQWAEAGSPQLILMISDLDLWYAADILVKRYGVGAPIVRFNVPTRCSQPETSRGRLYGSGFWLW